MILQKESQLKEFLPLYCDSLYVITSLQWVLCLFQWERDCRMVSVYWVTREMHLFTEKNTVFHMNYRRSLVWAVFIFLVKQRRRKVLILFQFACPKTQTISWYRRALKHMLKFLPVQETIQAVLKHIDVILNQRSESVLLPESCSLVPSTSFFN